MCTCGRCKKWLRSSGGAIARTGVRARVNKRGVPRSPALQKAEGKLSPPRCSSMAQLSLARQLGEGISSQGSLQHRCRAAPLLTDHMLLSEPQHWPGDEELGKEVNGTAGHGARLTLPPGAEVLHVLHQFPEVKLGMKHQMLREQQGNPTAQTRGQYRNKN